MVRPVAVRAGAAGGLAFLSLIWLFLRTDLSVKLVAENSHSPKPWLYKFAGRLGESRRLDAALGDGARASPAAGVALFERRLPETTMLATLAAQAVDRARLLRLPAVRLEPVRAARSRRRPRATGSIRCCRTPASPSIRRPSISAMSGISIAFSFAVGALVTRDVGPAFARAMRPWVLGAWIFLTLGITAGSYWAYYELGWGGWWFWDPVENASLMPWLAATALLPASPCWRRATGCAPGRSCSPWSLSRCR